MTPFSQFGGQDVRRAISRLVVALALLTGLGLGAEAAEQSVDITPDFVANIARGYGSAVLQKDSKGNPVIFGRIKGRAYAILFVGCERESCSVFQFVASISASGIGLERINAWNTKNRFGKAQLSGDKIFVSQPVVSRFGLPRQTLERYFVFWELVLDKVTPFLKGE